MIIFIMRFHVTIEIIKNNHMKKIICITGIDGIGKSTLISHLSVRLNSCYIANIWDLLNSDIQSLPFKSKKEIDSFLCGLSPDSRFLFLAHALKYSIDKAILSEKEIILADSYFYKYAATELALGAHPNLVKDVEEIFPVPDLVIKLCLSPDKIVLRKKFFSRYECGLSVSADKVSFVSFQKNVIKEWENFNFKNLYRLDASKTVNALVNEAFNIITNISNKNF